jgi:ferritin-like metal-binding protein YciE
MGVEKFRFDISRNDGRDKITVGFSSGLPGPRIYFPDVYIPTTRGAAFLIVFLPRLFYISGFPKPCCRRHPMPKITSLEDAFIHELSDIYSAEKQLTKALPKLARAASSSSLAGGFTAHADETQGQVERIDQIVEDLGIKLKRVKCLAMEGLVAEGQETVEEIEQGPVRDAMLIVGAQKVEHYEIAAYGSLITLAQSLGYDQAAKLLKETLAEEKATDEKLNQIALSEVNKEALATARGAQAAQ